MSAKRETPMPRLAGAVLCAAASLMLMLCSVGLFADGGLGWSAGLLLLAGVGLLAAAVNHSGRRGGDVVIIGGGKTQNYTALLLFLAGTAASGVAVCYSQIGGRWMTPTALSLLLMFAGIVLVAAKK